MTPQTLLIHLNAKYNLGDGVVSLEPVRTNICTGQETPKVVHNCFTAG